MKLITEYLDNTTEVTIEESESGQKRLYIEGIFMQAAKKNRNGRIYPTPVLEGAVNKYIEEAVLTNSAIGELNHPKSPIPDPNNASHRIVELRKEGDDFYGKALILNTPQGQKVRGLLEGEVRLGVSSRGLGTVREVNGVNEVQADFQLKTVDIVHNPSAPDAFINGIMEGVEFAKNGSIIDEEDVDRIEQTIKNTPAKDLAEVKRKLFIEAMEKMAHIDPDTAKLQKIEEKLNFKLDMFQKDWLKGAMKDPKTAEAEMLAMIESMKKNMGKASAFQKPIYKQQIDQWERMLSAITNV